MRVVITGGAGFLGSHLATELVRRGHNVVAVDNFVTGREANVAHLRQSPSFELVEADITQGLDVPGSVDGVLHFASPASPVDYLKLPIETLLVGSHGTQAALELADAKGARFVLASTSEVYGDPQVHPQPETYWGHVNPVGPRGVYDEAKRFGEAMTLAYRGARGVNAGIVRIFNTFGPRMRPDDGRAIPNFIRQALAGGPVTVSGDGSQTRSICYVDDLVRGILAMLLDTDAPGPVNIGNPHEISMLDLAKWIIELTESNSQVQFIERPTDDPTIRRPDTSRASELLNWAPQVAVKDGLEATIAWFREHEAPRGHAMTPTEAEDILNRPAGETEVNTFRQSRNGRTIREASEITGLSERSVKRWTSRPRDEWLNQKVAEREDIRAYHDDQGHSWTETATHFKLHVDTVKRRAYRARKERAAERNGEIPSQDAGELPG